MALTAKIPRAEPRRISILGSTGSVGANTIDLIERDPERYQVVALTANRNVEALAAQARRLKPSVAVVADPDAYAPLKEALAGTGIETAAGAAAVTEAAGRPVDWMMAAIVGAAGLESTLAAVRQGAIVGLANKETLVCAGDLFMGEIEKGSATLVPVDSEHSAIFQVFETDHARHVERIILTASGGPFRTLSRAAMAGVTPEQAVAHPNWDMGAKISVDSATMMNKGLEVIEAHHLFPVSSEQIEVVVHPQSVIHSMVEYVDGSVLAQMGTPDMRTPIAFALGWPERMKAPSARLDFKTLGPLTFESPDPDQFPALRLAREALEAGGAAPAILNAANEIAVRGFLDGVLPFLAITEIVEACLERLPARAVTSIEDVRAIDTETRSMAAEAIADLGRRRSAAAG
ncbi:MAG TPA: 1-deoxy-D-xylulose-5-phosphate reductoisomerase [Alphaproteobacteria bacterium]|nr:1-deoxy-D-xylulose-5-phosphate reductoisomerase [Alphaproteobacteria bacterium]